MDFAKSTAIKVCGVTRPDQAIAISALGVDAIGVIGVKTSPRFVPEVYRRELFKKLKDFAPEVKRVWVVADIDNSTIENALEGEGVPTSVQLHGRETKCRCAFLKGKHPKIEWWKALSVKSPNELSLARDYSDAVDYLLLDAWSPDQLGGTGKQIPLEWLSKNNLDFPWWLAGGINSEAIPEILKRTNPIGIDASSKLEKTAGVKDLEKVKALVNAIRFPKQK